MSDTESFDSVMAEMRKIVMDCDMERCDMYDGDCYKCQYDILERMQRAHERELEHVRKAEYARGYHDGQHSMDAEHYAVALRLNHLPLDEDSHGNLSQIARAVWHADFGWTQDACRALRDELVRLMGGVHEPSSFAKSGDFGKLDSTNDGEIDNERHKAIVELRKINTDAGGFVKALANALGVEWHAPRVHQTIAEVRDRLIHLLGGDEPTLSEVAAKLRQVSVDVMNKRADQSHESSPMSLENETGITDELREKIHEKVNQELYVVVEADDLYAIADRIDERFNHAMISRSSELGCYKLRINQLEQERDKMRAMLTEQRDEARTKVLKLESENTEWKRGAELDADKLESLTGAYNDAVAERDNLLDLLRDAVADFKNASYGWNYAVIVGENITIETERNRLAKERDELQAKLDAIREALDG